jgi:hypothetical protein
MRNLMLNYVKLFFGTRHLRLLFKVYLLFMVLAAILTVVAFSSRGSIFGVVGFICGIVSGLVASSSWAARLYHRWRARADALAHELGSTA